MAKKQKTNFAISKDGDKLFVKANAIMNPLCAMFDGIPIVQFGGKDKTIYLEIDVAIAWVKKEMQHHSVKDYKIVLTHLEEAKKQHLAGTLDTVD